MNKVVSEGFKEMRSDSRLELLDFEKLPSPTRKQDGTQKELSLPLGLELWSRKNVSQILQ